MEREYVDRTGIQMITIWDIDEWGIDKTIDRILDIAWNGTDGVVLHTDLDVLDQGFTTGVTTPETGGLTPREVIKMIRAFVRRGVDAYVITECSSVYDPANKAARVADPPGARRPGHPRQPGRHGQGLRPDAARCASHDEATDGAGGDRVRVIFATDLHGSEAVFRKFLNAVTVYEATVAILGGDLTGSASSRWSEDPEGSFAAEFNGREFRAE